VQEDRCGKRFTEGTGEQFASGEFEGWPVIAIYFYLVVLICMLITHGVSLADSWDDDDFDSEVVIACLKCLLWPVAAFVSLIALLVNNRRTVKAMRRGGL
jgi:uncharacterized membrane protein